MAYDDAPLFWLKQAIGQLDQDWTDDYTDAYEALESWFVEAAPNEEVLHRITHDVDQLFADEPDEAARMAHFPHNQWRPHEFDEFLRAIRKRAADGLAGNPEPMRAPEG